MLTLSIVGGPSIQVPFTQGMNVQTLLEQAYTLINNAQKFTYGIQFYGPNLGYLVMMINETYDSFLSSSAPFWYWELLVNGQPASQGIDYTILNDNDVITFSLEMFSPEKHKTSTLTSKNEMQLRMTAS